MAECQQRSLTSKVAAGNGQQEADYSAEYQPENY